MLYRTLLGIDILAGGVMLYFFVIGIADGSVSSFNIGLWVALIVGVAAILIAGVKLKTVGQSAAANGVLLVLAAPAFLYGLFIVLILITQPRWN